MSATDTHGPRHTPSPAIWSLLRRLQSGFIKAQAASTSAHQMTGGMSASLHACLVLERWGANPLADHLQEHHPAMADERADVPDEIYKDRPEAAPTLVPLPADWASNAPCDQTQAVLLTLAVALASARQQSHRRLAEQTLCGVVFSPASPAAIAMHWTRLGFQTSPMDGNDKLFRFQDARVMQRVWPVLDDAQRSSWLGPVTEWWALEQPWGPWASVGVFDQGDEADGTGDAPAHQPEWFIASRFAMARALRKAPGTLPSREAMRHLLHLPQWHAAHSASAGNRSWFRMASQQVPVHRQPDGQTMTRLLGQGAEMGLSRDSDIADFIDASWRTGLHAGMDSLHDWSAPQEAAVLQQALALMYPAPDLAKAATALPPPTLSFASALRQARQAAAGRKLPSRNN
ncbi:DUF4123 domain-containing protein [uncultured Variovorax sp.]|uniref:DUF4123 domain-containing protein n=1 Tax=uncultured Variovorax sp. TaxID=114708 RepID=UPI0025DA8183|nr:DUF4123 domain-containing protein [uncultured Variovorax sp.]